MAARLSLRVWILVALSGACVDSFSGSRVELVLHSGVQVPGDDPAGSGRPPSDTHYEMYVVKDGAVFHVHDFEIQPVIRVADRCFIEDESSRFPGLHSTMIVDKLTQEDMIGGGEITDAEAGDIAVAEVRRANMALLETSMKVIVSHEAGLTDATVAAFQETVPPPDMTDDQTNALRLSKCRQFFAQHPGYYVGNDKIVSIPINGVYEGIVEGTDPRTGVVLGAAEFDVAASLPDIDAMRINWSFNDPGDPRRSMYSPSEIGWHYMAGEAVRRERGVINVSMRNNDFSQIAGEAAIYTNLDDDNVHF